jgi:hypothetical protein
LLCAPSMGAVLRVQVPPKGDHLDRSDPQLREGGVQNLSHNFFLGRGS